MLNDAGFAGPCSPLPTVALSPGHEGIYWNGGQSATFDTFPDLQWLPASGYSSVPAAKRWKRPRMGAEAQGILNVSGIAWDQDSTVNNLWILVDGSAACRHHGQRFTHGLLQRATRSGMPACGLLDKLESRHPGDRSRGRTL